MHYISYNYFPLINIEKLGNEFIKIKKKHFKSLPQQVTSTKLFLFWPKNLDHLN
jgi:hypothetical protein